MNFISIVNDLFPIALQFRLLSVWNIIQLRMSIFTLSLVNVLFPIALLYYCLFWNAVFCAITVLYTGTSLVSNDYLDSNKCSVDLINFISLVNDLFPIALQLDYCLYETLSSWECLSLHFTSFSPCSYSEMPCFVRSLSCIQNPL